ncbi:MAG: tyrosine--tRNA ligase [Spirochaetota bacterium]
MNIEEAIHKIRRGTVEIIPEKELIEKLQTGKPLKIKAGFDPTAPDLHLGHAVLLRKMRHFQDLGHEVHFLLGDFTAMIGDPTGKSETRKRLTKEEVQENAKTYESQVFQILDPEKTKIVFNSAWCSTMNFEDVLMLTAKYNVARLLERDDFSKRFKAGNPISLIEFLYPLVQGYDSVAMQCDVELGGTDQKFNLLVGRELQRDYGVVPQVVITLPLLVGLDGVKKMSKSLGNYIGFHESALDMYGKIMSISDELMWNYYELLTDLPESAVEERKQAISTGDLHPKEAKSLLAQEVSKQFHKSEKIAEAVAEWQKIHNAKNRAIPSDIPQVKLTAKHFEEENPMILQILVEQGMLKSISEGLKLIKSGGLYLNEERLTDSKYPIELGQEYIIRKGKKGNFLKIVS